MRSKTTAALLAGLVISVASCADELPTLSDQDSIADGPRPTTIEFLTSAADVLIGTNVIGGETSAKSATYTLVANNFDGALSSHSLTAFAAFPDTLDLTEGVDSTFTYLESQVVAVVSDTIATSQALLDFQLWTITESWDSMEVSWENARPGVPWSQPGGTRGRMLGMARWERADTAASADSLVWNIPRTTVDALANGDIPGLMVTLQQDGSRAQLSSLAVRAFIQSTINTDSSEVRVIGARGQNFIFTPDAPRPDTVLRVGGLTSDRSQVRFDISQLVPGCAAGTLEACPDGVALEDVALYRAFLVLDPVPVTSGFRPLRSLPISVRLLFEPELGDQSPLGPVVALDSLSVDQARPGGQPLEINVTAAVERALIEERTEVALALLTEASPLRFGYGWFDPKPRLRLIYTLPQRPVLP